MRSCARVAAALALSAVMAVALRASADDKTTAAEGYFREGIAAMKENKFPQACAAFDASNNADPSPGTQINLGLCNEKQGKVASAWAWYNAAAALATDRGQDERAALARKEADRVAPLLTRVIINGKPADAKATVKLDDVEVKFGLESRVDPGSHAVEVVLAGKKTFKTTVNVDKSGAGVQTVDVPALADDPDALKVGAGVGGGQGQGGGPGADHPTTTENTSQRNIGLVVGGAGIVALIAGGAVQILALSESGKASDDSNQEKTDNCSQPQPANSPCPSLQSSYNSHHNAALGDQTAAIIIAGAGAVMLGVGIVLFLTSSKSSAAAARPLVVPIVGKDTTGLGLAGVF
jgi:hypothetical protein